MAKAGANNEITEDVFEQIVDSRAHPIAKIEYLSDAEIDTNFDDIVSFSVGKSGVNNDYNAFSLVPPSSSFNMGVFNARQKYSPGTGNEFDGVLVRDRQVSPFIGYKVTKAAGITDTLNEVLDLTAGTILYHTQESGGALYNDVASAASLPTVPGITFFPYDSILYDDETYSCEGVWASAILTFNNDPNTTLRRLEVVADTTDIEIYLRDGCNSTDILTQSFVKLGNTVNGTQRIDVSNSNKVYQVAFVWCTGLWSSVENCITSSKLFFYTRSAFFDQGDYFLDDPSFSAAYGNYSASTGGRDYIKKAIETKITTPSYASATDVGQIVRDISDRAGIPNDSTSVPDVGTTVIIADDDNFKNETANDALNECIVYLNALVDNYRVRINDDSGKLELYIKVESTINADFNYTYKEALVSFSKTLLTNNFIQRATVSTGDVSTTNEYKLRELDVVANGSSTLDWGTVSTVAWTRSGTLITVTSIEHQFIVGETVSVTAATDTNTIPIASYIVTTTADADTFTFNAVATGASSGTIDYDKSPSGANPEAIHKRMVVTINNSTISTVTVDDASLTDIDVTVSGGTPVDLKIEVFGSYVEVGNPVVGESVNSVGWSKNNGITKDIENRLIQNSSDAQLVADEMTALFSDQGFKASLKIPFDPLREIDDKITIWEKFTNTSRIFAIESISHSFSAAGAGAGTNLGLLDLGVDFANFNWDRNNVINGGTNEGVDDIHWDQGRLYDEVDGPLSTSDTVTNVNDFRNIG